MRVSFSQSQKNDPEVRAGVRIPYSPGKRSVSKLLWWSILALVFTPLLILLWNLIFGWFFISSPGVISLDTYPITAAENGVITEIGVKKRSDVQAGSVAMRLQREPAPELLNQIALMKAEREELASYEVR